MVSFRALILSALIVASATTTEAFVIDTSPSLLASTGMRNKSLVQLSLNCDAPGCDREEEYTTKQSRKQFLQSTLSFSMISTMGMGMMIQTPAPANAAYGDTSNIALPNYIDFLIEKNAAGLPVDQSKVLYKGTDIEVQIKRISDAARRLNEIPSIAKDKKWSQVQGILLGPLGTLVMTMNSLVKETEDASGEAKKAAAKVKGDIILISQEATKKNEGGVVKACGEAQRDLEAFAKLVF